MRLALLSPTWWPEVRRGTERFARDLADGLLARGHQARLITSHRGLPSRRVEDGLEVVRVWRPPDGRLRRRLWEEHLTHVPLSYLALRRGDDELAHALYPTDALAGARWGREAGRPVVLSYMGIAHHRGLANRRGRVAIVARAMAEADAVVVLSQAAARGCERWLGVRPRVIAPGVDLAAFAPAPTPGTERAEAPTICCPADLGEPRKRVALLVEAHALVRRDRPGARLVLSRPRDPALAGHLLSSAAGVELADVDERDALAGAYRRAWTVALPSLDEAFGLVLAEGLACGTPVVATASGALPELVDRPAIGRLFEGDDAAALARALLEALELSEDPGTAAACRARVQELSVERMVEAYEGLYIELAAEVRRTSTRQN